MSTIIRIPSLSNLNLPLAQSMIELTVMASSLLAEFHTFPNPLLNHFFDKAVGIDIDIEHHTDHPSEKQFSSKTFFQTLQRVLAVSHLPQESLLFV
jgi:hypothetical protein